MTPEQLRSAIEDLLEELDLDRSAVRLGNTQVRRKTLCFHILQFQKQDFYSFLFSPIKFPGFPSIRRSCPLERRTGFEVDRPGCPVPGHPQGSPGQEKTPEAQDPAHSHLLYTGNQHINIYGRKRCVKTIFLEGKSMTP